MGAGRTRIADSSDKKLLRIASWLQDAMSIGLVFVTPILGESPKILIAFISTESDSPNRT